MAKAVLTEYEKFERKMKNLEPNVQYVWFTGELARTRMIRDDVDRMAAFVGASHSLGYSQSFQRRNRDNPRLFDHIIVLHDRLGMRQDGNGRFQEAERVSAFHGIMPT